MPVLTFDEYLRDGQDILQDPILSDAEKLRQLWDLAQEPMPCLICPNEAVYCRAHNIESEE